MKKVVMGLSGGMDSATLLGLFLNQGYEVHSCLFNYGSKHNPYENKAAYNILAYYQELKSENAWNSLIELYGYGFDLRHAFVNFRSNLLSHGGDIPEGHYASDNMKKTIVPGRNLIFISLMASLAESINADFVAFGAHSGDHHIYPDCRPDFVYTANQVVYKSTEGRVNVIAPFSNDNKISILEKGFALHPRVPYELTRTCYKNQELACGKCGSCRERLEAFEKLGVTDPVQYEQEA